MYYSKLLWISREIGFPDTAPGPLDAHVMERIMDLAVGLADTAMVERIGNRGLPLIS